jgi:hypothetical protein
MGHGEMRWWPLLAISAIAVWLGVVVWFIAREPDPGRGSAVELSDAYAAALTARDRERLAELLSLPADPAEGAQVLLEQFEGAGVGEVQVRVDDPARPQVLEVTGRAADGRLVAAATCSAARTAAGRCG